MSVCAGLSVCVCTWEQHVHVCACECGGDGAVEQEQPLRVPGPPCARGWLGPRWPSTQTGTDVQLPPWWPHASPEPWFGLWLPVSKEISERGQRAGLSLMLLALAWA